MSRKDAKELGEHLDEGQAALIVIGKSRVQEQLDKALTRAQKSEEREVDADAKELEKELNALPELAGNVVALASGRDHLALPLVAHRPVGERPGNHASC